MANARMKPQKPSYMDRREDEFDEHPRILIVCEGAKTEPNYFNSFRVTTLVVKVIGAGMNTQSLVDETVRLMREDDYDQVWVVFDKDDFPIDQFENAISSAESHSINVAYSNQSFELWYLLHFEYLTSALSRSQYMRKLNEWLKPLGLTYQKNTGNMYSILRCNMDTAIKNAQRLQREYSSIRPGKNDPLTTVFKLVLVLNEQSKPFGHTK
jgi:hypothetical protein